VKTREMLLELFVEYPLAVPAEATTFADIRTHYDTVGAKLGFTLEPPDLVLTLAGNGMMERGAYREALVVMNHLAMLYPASMNGIWGLANLHRVMGDTTVAIRYYEECLRRDPNMTPAREWLRRLSRQ
jgi:tetratricopeptide (TPR) repeat protein